MNPVKRPTRSVLWLSVLPIVSLVLAFLTSCSTSVAKPSAKGAMFQDDMRKLWEDHIVYTRNFIIDAAAGLPEQQATTERLLRNQDDIGNAIKPYYGEENGAKLTALLKEHITTAAELVTAAKANDTAKVDDAKKRWFDNADAIASFLSGANPKSWPEADMKSMMHDHLNLTNDEAAAQLKSDWKGSIDAYDKIHEQILRMADMLSSGIVAQFPKQF
jgi:hypothetical protein